jgi:hypothetical protein
VTAAIEARSPNSSNSNTGEPRACNPRQRISAGASAAGASWAIARATSYLARSGSGGLLFREALPASDDRGSGGDRRARGVEFGACFHAIGQIGFVGFTVVTP